MKKFGTPNGAGPGSANEYVGFNGDGTPPFPRNRDASDDPGATRRAAAGVLDERTCPDRDELPAATCVTTEGRSRRVRPAPTGATRWASAGGAGGAAVAVEVVVLVVAGGAAGAAHDSETDTTPRWIGRFNADTGVPAGTSTVNVSEVPPPSCTVTEQGSAEAAPAVARPASVATGIAQATPAASTRR
jgi:hypothetical protein